jgi:magnesium-transporting ATPase (P-type)
LTTLVNWTAVPSLGKIFKYFRLICNERPSCCHDQEKALSMTNRSTADRLEKPPPTDWHTLAQSQVEKTLQTGTDGLTEAEARLRLTHYGPNRLAPPKRRGPLLRLLMQFHNILLYVMMGAAVITALLGHWVDTGVLMIAVVINAIIGFIQEGKAESALDAIRAMLSPHATVIRDGQRREIDAAGLVPGDVVVLASGDRVPADLRLIDVRELRIEEAALTGESLPVEKTSDPVGADAPLGDRYGMAYSGTLVV